MICSPARSWGKGVKEWKRGDHDATPLRRAHDRARPQYPRGVPRHRGAAGDDSVLDRLAPSWPDNYIEVSSCERYSKVALTIWQLNAELVVETELPIFVGID